VRARSIVVSRVSGEHTAQVALAKNNDVVQAFAAKRANQSLGYTILPRRARRDRTISNAHGPNAGSEDLPIGAVIVPAVG
jgi:hypothetical protein